MIVFLKNMIIFQKHFSIFIFHYYHIGKDSQQPTSYNHFIIYVVNKGIIQYITPEITFLFYNCHNRMLSQCEPDSVQCETGFTCNLPFSLYEIFFYNLSHALHLSSIRCSMWAATFIPTLTSAGENWSGPGGWTSVYLWPRIQTSQWKYGLQPALRQLWRMVRPGAALCERWAANTMII